MLSLHPTIKSAGTYHATTAYSYRYIAVPVQLYRYNNYVSSNDYILVPVYSCTCTAVGVAFPNPYLADSVPYSVPDDFTYKFEGIN
eukprot:COSAG05_NODE_4732_length_1392_cov_4.034803_1_plen_85_part_10